ncbi:uncharacterized protein AKAME5_000460200 [Lates japonicus]|uniref:Uncharacterized protein n=1 Tax=Lates japonicus TaxID=270547 RepID=A0AAD3MDN3_LATJO|nr:uncharacterized protein AKAME5_000460200 [Lates japonicus]
MAPFGSPTHGQILSLPTMEAPGQGGLMLVFRPWSEQDILEAIAHVTSPVDNLDMFQTQFEQFVREYGPTTVETR